MKPSRLALLAFCLPLAACVAPKTQAERELPFRAIMQGFANTDTDGFWAREHWDARFAEWSRMGYNAVVWWGPGEFFNGQQMFVRHEAFPEARELSSAESDRLIEYWQWIFRRAHAHGLQNVLKTQHIFFTSAFADAHGLEGLGPVSETVGKWHVQGYPNWSPRSGEPGLVHHCDVRTELTRAYTEAVYLELLKTYPELDGFYGYCGEPVPGSEAHSSARRSPRR